MQTLRHCFSKPQPRCSGPFSFNRALKTSPKGENFQLGARRRRTASRATSPWQEFVDPATNRPYYWNSETNESVWADEVNAPVAAAEEPPLLGLSGLAPEVVNARVAMVGFMGLLSGELVDGLSIWEQLGNGGFGALILASLAVTTASFAPGLRQVPWDRVFGKDANPIAFGPINPQTELINGRAAMLGISAIAILEGLARTMIFV